MLTFMTVHQMSKYLESYMSAFRIQRIVLRHFWLRKVSALNDYCSDLCTIIEWMLLATEGKYMPVNIDTALHKPCQTCRKSNNKKQEYHLTGHPFLLLFNQFIALMS